MTPLAVDTPKLANHSNPLMEGHGIPAATGAGMNNSFQTIAAEDLASVGGGINIGALAQGIGSLFGQKGEAIGGQIGQIAGGIQNLIGMFRGGGQPQAGGQQPQGAE